MMDRMMMLYADDLGVDAGNDDQHYLQNQEIDH